MNSYAYVYVYESMYIYVCIHMCICMCTCIHMYIYIYVYIHTCICVYICVRVRVCACVCVCVRAWYVKCMYKCFYVYLCLSFFNITINAHGHTWAMGWYGGPTYIYIHKCIYMYTHTNIYEEPICMYAYIHARET